MVIQASFESTWAQRMEPLFAGPGLDKSSLTSVFHQRFFVLLFSAVLCGLSSDTPDYTRGLCTCPCLCVIKRLAFRPSCKVTVSPPRASGGDTRVQ